MLLLSGRKFTVFAVIWTIVITVLSLVTIKETPSFVLQLPFKDKIVHFIFYFVFVILWCFSLLQIKNNLRFKILLTAVFYGIIIEVLQCVVTENRTADFYDVLANTLGAIVAFIIFPYLEKIFIKTEIKN